LGKFGIIALIMAKHKISINQLQKKIKVESVEEEAESGGFGQLPGKTPAGRKNQKILLLYTGEIKAGILMWTKSTKTIQTGEKKY